MGTATAESNACIPYDHMPEIPGVYRIVNEKTGETYIGGTSNMARRARQHSVSLRCKNHVNIRLSDSYATHGFKAFRFEVVEAVPADKVVEREREWRKNSRPTFNANDLITGRPKSRQCAFVQVTVYCEPSLANRIDEEAKRDGRKRSNMAQRLLEEALDERNKSTRQAAMA